jgi:prepilin-type N-terminal cleavage/methylation domain-containing protein
LRPNAGAVASRRHVCRNSGFTLVEVIVVLVILAILAAIAIPALTGYIAKAEDKKYVSKARNTSVAMKTLLNEDYASGKIDRDAHAKQCFTQGTDLYSTYKMFAPSSIANALDDYDHDHEAYYKQAATLMGEAYDESGEHMYWVYYPLTSRDSSATAATADGFLYFFYPEGYNTGETIICVTYKLERLTAPETVAYLTSDQDYSNSAVYNPNAGYEVYKAIVE